MSESRQLDQGSRDEAFLQRTDALRLRQEWVCDLDMRQYVSEPCKRYRYRRRVYWLDAESRKLFVEGLKRNGGVFTVATYEAILARVKSESDQVLPHSPMIASLVEAKSETKHRTDDKAVRQLHQILKLGYFEKRRKDRIKYATRVLLIGDGLIIPGRTRDISETGIQVRTTFSTSYEVGDVLKVQFPDLPEAKNARVSYRVIRVVRRLNEFFVCLHCEDERSRPVNTLLRNLAGREGDSSEGKVHVDVEDALLTAESLLAERHYMCSTASIPFFLARSGLRSARMTAIFYNEANAESLFALNTMIGGNGLAETINRRHLRHFMKLAKVDGQIHAMLALWLSPDGGNLETLMDLECRTDSDWYASLAQHCHEDAFRVYRVIVRKARRPNAHRLSRELKPFAQNSPTHAKQLLRDGRQLVAVGALMDATSEIRTWNLTPYESAATTEISQYIEERAETGGSGPELLPIQYVEKPRSHDRYLLEVDVTLEIQGKAIEAVTSDISRTGMSVILPPGTPPVALGTPVRATLSGMVENVGVLDRLRRSLERVSYQVVSIGSGKEILLRLRLQDSDRQGRFARALSIFLQNRHSTLNVEKSHSVQAAASRFYSSFFVEAPAALPVLYFRAKADGSALAKVGLSRKLGPLAAFFEIADGRFDFSAITEPAWTSRLLSELEQGGHGEMNVFLVKDRIPGQARYRISSVADFGFADRKERGEFLDYAVGREFRIVKVLISPPHNPSSRELELVLKRFERYSPRRAARLRGEFEHLVAVGDLVDITTNFHELRYIAP